MDSGHGAFVLAPSRSLGVNTLMCMSWGHVQTSFMYYAARSRENLSNSDKSPHHVNYWACKFSSFWAITGRWDKRRWIWYQHTFGLSDCIFNGWQILGTCVKEFWSPDPSLCRTGQIVSCSALSFQFLVCVNDSAVGWWCSPRNQKDRHLGTQKLCQAWQLHPLHQYSPLWGQDRSHGRGIKQTLERKWLLGSRKSR